MTTDKMYNLVMEIGSEAPKTHRTRHYANM